MRFRSAAAEASSLASDVGRLLDGDQQAEREGVLEVDVGAQCLGARGTAPPRASEVLPQRRELLEDDHRVGHVTLEPEPMRRLRKRAPARDRLGATSAYSSAAPATNRT